MRRRIAAPLLAAALAAALAAPARAETLVVGEAAGVPLWELGVAYAPLNATVGDELVRASGGLFRPAAAAAAPAPRPAAADALLPDLNVTLLP